MCELSVHSYATSFLKGVAKSTDWKGLSPQRLVIRTHLTLFRAFQPFRQCPWRIVWFVCSFLLYSVSLPLRGDANWWGDRSSVLFFNRLTRHRYHQMCQKKKFSNDLARFWMVSERFSSEIWFLRAFKAAIVQINTFANWCFISCFRTTWNSM